MADNTEEETQEKRVSPNYDESLGTWLLENKVNRKTVWDILVTRILHGSNSIITVDHRILKEKIIEEMVEHHGGTIYVLPSGRRDGKSCILWSSLSSQEIKRIVSLKAFL